ncbi:hypothethical protein (plasmid) [Ralstonia solanacearum PSI07]|nr:hypothethical protein [Ralstonia solanacearum PSI07]
MAEPGPMMERFDRWPPIELCLSQVAPSRTIAPLFGNDRSPVRAVFDIAIVHRPPAACHVGGYGPTVARWLRDGPQCWVRICSVALSPD